MRMCGKVLAIAGLGNGICNAKVFFLPVCKTSAVSAELVS